MIGRRKPRKEFATGARTLRGGKNIYTAKTLCGNWVEAQYDPSFEALARESKYDEKYESTSALDAKDGIGVTLQPFGAGMEQFRTLKAGPNLQDQPSKNWQSVTASMFRGNDPIKTEFTTSFKTTGGMKDAAIYRARWTSEGEALRDRRFTTTNMAAAEYQDTTFQQAGPRALIGVPNAMNKLRETLVFKNGTDTGHVVNRAFSVSGSEVMTQQELEDALIQCIGGLTITSGAPVSPETQLGLAVGELATIVRHLDGSGSGYVRCSDFVACLLGGMSDARKSFCRNLFHALVGSESKQEADIQAMFSDFYRGTVRESWSLYVSNGVATSGDFIRYYAGASASIRNDSEFERFVNLDWDRPDLKVTKRYNEMVKVEVTRTDGSTSVEMVECDPAARFNVKLLRPILLARGVAVKSLRFV